MAATQLPPSRLLSKAPYVVAAALVPLAYWAITDYQAWRGLPPGGVPYNVYGWAQQHFALAAKAKFAPRDTRPFEDEALLSAGPCDAAILRRSFLKEALTRRPQERPAMFPWAVPHRQKTQANTAQMRAEMVSFMEGLASPSSGVKTDTSGLEGHGLALYAEAKDGKELLAQAKPTKGEFAHIHQFEGSAHVLLSWKDAKSVIDLGWGERHPLGGSPGMLPMAYTLVYAPRDDEEFRVWKGILKASVDFMHAEN